jgi:hypothetical protein
MMEAYMRTVIFGVLFVLAGCAGSGGGSSSGEACSGSPFVGSWTGSILSNPDTMVFTNSCAVTSTYCASTGTIPATTNSSGSVVVTVTSTNANSGCLPAGNTTCNYSISGNSLSFNCGGGVITYTK